MKRSGSALRACAALERREAAQVRAALSVSRSLDAAAAGEMEALRSTRAAFASACVWTAQSCRFMDLRAVRSTSLTGSLHVEADRARAQARAHGEVRLRWATLVHGLRRREERRGARELPCLD